MFLGSGPHYSKHIYIIYLITCITPIYFTYIECLQVWEKKYHAVSVLMPAMIKVSSRKEVAER